MSETLLKLVTDPALILASVPFIKLLIQWLLRRVFKDLTMYSLGLAASDNRDDVSRVGNSEETKIALASYLKYGAGLQKFFETIIFALLSAVVGYFTYHGGRAWVPSLWVVFMILITVSLIVVGVKLFKQEIDPAVGSSTKGINKFALSLNALVVALEAYAKLS